MVSKSLNVGGVAYKKTGLNGESSDSLMLLLDLIDEFTRLDDYQALLKKVASASQSIMGAEASSILLLNKERREFSVECCTGPVKDDVKGARISEDRGYCGWVATHKLPLIVNEIEDEDEIFGGELSENFTTHNLICAPLLDNNDRLIGVIEAVNCNERKQLNEKDLPMFQVLANHAATAIKRGQLQQQQSNRMKEQNMYLTEIHHRVKNDLALISGIVEIESLDIKNEEARKVLKNIQSRIKSMAVVYELLSGQDAQNKAELGAYIKKLAEGISKSLKNRTTDIDIEIETDEITIDPYKALSCGLIINELILNTYKHAFNEQNEGLITIRIVRNNGSITMDYRDNGSGLPDGFDVDEQDSLGFKMIEALIKQLEGTMEVFNNNGSQFLIAFENDENGVEEPQSVLKR